MQKEKNKNKYIDTFTIYKGEKMIIEEKEYKPKIYEKKIKYIQEDYELHLKDLINIKIEYDNQSKKIYAKFETIYIYDIEKLTAINLIHGNYKNYKLNGYYERQENKSHSIIIGKDIIEYLFNWEKEYLNKIVPF